MSTATGQFGSSSFGSSHGAGSISSTVSQAASSSHQVSAPRPNQAVPENTAPVKSARRRNRARPNSASPPKRAPVKTASP